MSAGKSAGAVYSMGRDFVQTPQECGHAGGAVSVYRVGLVLFTALRRLWTRRHAANLKVVSLSSSWENVIVAVGVNRYLFHAMSPFFWFVVSQTGPLVSAVQGFCSGPR